MTQDNQPSQNSVPPMPPPAMPPTMPPVPPPGYPPQMPPVYAQPYQYPPPPSSGKNIGLILGIIALVIVLVGGGCLISILLPALNAAKERANRVKCASNLRQIGQALQLYANDNKMYPRTYYDYAVAASFKPDFTGGAKTSPSSNPFLAAPNGTVGTNNVLAAAFLLVRTVDINQEVFVCPSSSQQKDTFGGGTLTSKDVSNFTSAANVSYSFANMYPTGKLTDKGIMVASGYKWSPNVTADFAIAADRNDGFTTANAGVVAALTSSSVPAQQRLANSRNHEQDGQNILYNDGHVEWAQTMWVGANKDGIFTAAKLSIEGWQDSPDTASKDTTTTDPQLDLDTILLPKF
ncbi:MAG: hypothetical protein ABSH20_01675 [Tepidisphaeraceae bacterium]|jgi:prepilin-type processing-associated H-X9-DG protein